VNHVARILGAVFLGHLEWTLVALFLGAAILAPRLGDRRFRSVEGSFSRLAAKRTLAICLIFLCTIVVRLLFLPLIPAPVPGMHDEFAYLLQADTFFHGRLANPPHPLWMSFETFHVNWWPTYSGIYPPAQGLVLALGILLGHPWIGVLLSEAAMCAAVVWMLQGWMPARWAFLGGVMVVLKLSLVSYWMNSYWGGAVPATGGALVLGALPRIYRKPSAQNALVMGLGAAILANSRPYEGFFLCLPVAVALLIWLARKSSPPLRVTVPRVVAPAAVLLALTTACLGYYNSRLTGHALLPPYILNLRTYHVGPVFLWQKPGASVHYNNPQFDDYYNGWLRASAPVTWSDVERLTRAKLQRYGYTFLWAGSAPLLICLPLVFRDRRSRFMLTVLALNAAALFVLVWYMPHYAAPVTGAIYALLVQSLRHVRTLRFGRRLLGLGLSRAIVLLLLAAVGMNMYTRILLPYDWDWNGNMGNSDRAAILAKLEGMPGKHLVLVRYGEDHNIHEEWVYNGADIDGSKVLWARDLGPAQNARLLAYFHDRKVWTVAPDGGWPVELVPYSLPQTAGAVDNGPKGLRAVSPGPASRQ